MKRLARGLSPNTPRPLPARGRYRGPGLFLDLATGATFIDTLIALAIGTALFAAAVPSAANLWQALSVRSAAAEVSAVLFRARSYAITRGVYVGLKFRRNGNNYEWTLYRDGNRNGIRTAEIASGIDRPVGEFYPWRRGDVRPGILTSTRVPDPSSPGRFLDRPDDPIRFNSSDICSFSALGESTPGSIYLWDGRDRMAVVRVYGRSAKVRTLFYRRGESEWKP